MPRLPIRAIITTWKACNQNYSATARQLGIDRRTVRRRVYRGRQPWGYVCRQGVQSRSTASKHPTRALSYEAAAQVRAWRETAGFCREKLAFLAIRTAKLDSMQHRATMTPSLWIWELVGK